MIKLFNTTKESLLEQKQIIEIIDFGKNKLNQQPPNTINGCVQWFHDTALKAYGNLDFSQDFESAEKFAKKMQGMVLEYICQAVINTHGRWIPGMPHNADHRSVHGIPDKETGSPDLVATSMITGRFINVSVKSSKDLKKSISANEYNTSNQLAWQRDRFMMDVTDPLSTAENMIMSNVKIGDNVIGFDHQVCGSKSSDSLGKIVDGPLFAVSFWDPMWLEMRHNIHNINWRQLFSKPLYDDQKQLLADPITNCGDSVMTAIGACSIGKSEVFRTLIEEDSMKIKGRGIYIISGPRIALLDQHNDTMHSTNKLYDVIVNTSGGEFEKHWNQNGFGRMTATTDPKKIAEKTLEYIRSGSNKPLLIDNTDIGLPRLQKALELIKDGTVSHEFWNSPEDAYSTVINWCRQAHHDEAHNLVVNSDKLKGQKKRNSLRVIKAIQYLNKVFDKTVFWTATKKTNGLKYDMNNQKIFGKIVAVYDFKTAVKNGRVLQPYVAVVKLDLTDDIIKNELDKQLVKDLDNEQVLELTFLVRAIKEHKSWCDLMQLPCQIMYFGTEVPVLPEFKKFLTQHFAKDNLVADYVSADTGHTARQKIFKKYENSKFSILMNYDIIGEGINIQSTTAVIVGRGMNDIKLVQSALRGTRLHKQDREDFAQGKLKVGGPGWRKPCSWLYVFSDQQSLEDVVRVENAKLMIGRLRTHGVYEFDIKVVGGTGGGPNPRPMPDPAEPVEHNDKIEDMLKVEIENYANQQLEQQLIDSLDIGSETLIDDAIKIIKEVETV
jgi:hypothetical protein